MGERRFVIAETDVNRILGCDTITESELYRRLMQIKYSNSFEKDKLFHILLPGDKESDRR